MSDARISFRAGAPLAEALAQCAERAGCSVSEYLRSIVRDHVGLSDPPPPINIAPQGAAPIHLLAARGDADALTQLAACHYQLGLNGTEPQLIAFARAVDYARLAVGARSAFDTRQGRAEWLNFLFLLDQYAAALRAAGYGYLADGALGEAVAYAECMGEEGDDEMSDMVAGSARQISAGAMTFARTVLDHAKELQA